MATSDDEGEMLPDAVSDYYFNDGKDEPLSFSKLAVWWNESENSSSNMGPIFLGGTVDNGLQKFYQQVKAWKYDLLTDIPEISVLSKDYHWIKLQKPRKSYEKLIRTILITVYCLCFFKSKPEASGKSLWDHLSKVFSLYDVRPSENDLIDHMDFIREAVKRDEILAKSKFLASFLENPRKGKYSDEDVGNATKPCFIVDDNHDEPQDDDFISKQTEDSESDGEDDQFDSVCAICDNGGDLTCCEGICFRSFHATGDSEEAQDSNCESLCLTPEELEGLRSQQYKCENCQYSLHQCFVCGKLGSSDKSSNTEVFRCSSATCGHFYHPECVAKLLQKNDKAERQTLKEKIAAGDPFICPAHKCAICKQTENEKVEDMQFAVCRRCPTSYHRKCIPRDIMFEHQVGEFDEIRAWDELLPKSRALIYCVKHDINPELSTPTRTIRFRNILHSHAHTSKKSSSLKSCLTSEPMKKKMKIAIKETGQDSEHTSKKSSLKSQKDEENSSSIKLGSSTKKRAAVSPGPEFLKRKKVADTSKDILRRNLSTKVNKPSLNDGQPTLGCRLFDFYTGTESNNLEDEISVDENKETVAAKSPHREVLPPLDDDSKQRIVSLMKEATSSVTLDEVKKYHQGKVPSTHAFSSRADKSIILSRVEGSVEALRVALKKLEEGCSVEDALAVCEPGVIDQLLRWKDKLKVYLAPFLHGMRYTSFGRHFTKVEKLEKIVDKLHWYIEDGDTVVDFCCGANDFSCLMKKRLDEMGKKKCSYKNYDITRPKNDFNFEKRDWMTVATKELPSGSQLIMGLNPPFGINASLANKFIDKALLFKPKLIILIVPPETERLDRKRKKIPYDLVWEDFEMLAGKSFYLPGSADVNDKLMDQWNMIAPPLYLWSRSDWTDKHKSIAQKHGHIPKLYESLQSNENVPDSGLQVVANGTEDGLPVVNKDSDRIIDEAKPDTKRRKKESHVGDNGGTETKNKSTTKDETSNKILNTRNGRNQEFKIEKDNEKCEVEARAPSRERTRPRSHEVETQKLDKSRAPSREVETQKNELARVPPRESEAQKLATSLAPSGEVEAKENDLTRAPPRESEAQKLEKARAPSHEVETKKNDLARAPPRESEAQKLEKARAPSSLVETKKNDLNQVPPRESEAQKLEKARAISLEIEAQKHEITLVPSREPEALKHEKARAFSRQVEREVEAQKHERTKAPSREVEPRKHEKTWASIREVEGSKLGKKHSRAPSREFQGQSLDNKYTSPPAREDQAHETLHYDFSFVDVDQSFDQHTEERYNSTIDESTFSLQNDLGLSFDQHFERKYSSTNDEPYMGSTHRRLDGANLPTPSYSMRPDHLQYSGYDRVGRGSYFDEMSARGGSYSTGQHEPGLNRYGSAEATPYNRTSTSATQRYAPRLDELNHTRFNNSGRSELDDLNHSRMNSLGRPEPPMGSRGIGGYGLPQNGPRPGFHMDTVGFAPGPYHQYSHHNSSGGWLNE